MKNKVSSLIAEGILFCGSGILLLSYSLISYAKAFNKAWSQSPYLFPALVGAAQDLQRLILILELAALVLALHHHSGGDVCDPDGAGREKSADQAALRGHQDRLY